MLIKSFANYQNKYGNICLTFLKSIPLNQQSKENGVVPFSRKEESSILFGFVLCSHS